MAKKKKTPKLDFVDYVMDGCRPFHARHKMSGITSAEIVKALEVCRGLHEATHRYFRYDCLFWRAFLRYVEEVPVHHCVLFDKSYPVMILRGLGVAVSLKQIFPKPAGGGKDADNLIRFMFGITCYDEDRDRELAETHMIDVPIDLVEEFTQSKFDAWIESHRKHLKDRSKETAQEIVDFIRKRWPYAGDETFAEVSQRLKTKKVAPAVVKN